MSSDMKIHQVKFPEIECSSAELQCSIASFLGKSVTKELLQRLLFVSEDQVRKLFAHSERVDSYVNHLELPVDSDLVDIWTKVTKRDVSEVIISVALVFRSSKTLYLVDARGFVIAEIPTSPTEPLRRNKKKLKDLWFSDSAVK